ncbi:hypothetical protein D3C81_1672700 [compost metagenome]
MKKNGSQRFIIRVDRSHVFTCFFFNYFTDFNVLIPSDILKILSLISGFFQIIGAVEHTGYTDIEWNAVNFSVNRKRIHFVLRKLFEINLIRKVCKSIRISGYIFLNVRIIYQNDVWKTFLNACRQVGIQFLLQIRFRHINDFQLKAWIFFCVQLFSNFQSSSVKGWVPCPSHNFLSCSCSASFITCVRLIRLR